MSTPAISDPDVAAAFDAFPDAERSRLMRLRELIFETAADLPNAGRVSESLKWGQPSYATDNPSMGSPIRIGLAPKKPARPDTYALYVHCGTSLAAAFRDHYGNLLTIDGKRAILLPTDQDPPEEALRHCIAMALTYRRG